MNTRVVSISLLPVCLLSAMLALGLCHKASAEEVSGDPAIHTDTRDISPTCSVGWSSSPIKGTIDLTVKRDGNAVHVTSKRYLLENISAPQGKSEINIDMRVWNNALKQGDGTYFHEVKSGANKSEDGRWHDYVATNGGDVGFPAKAVHVGVWFKFALKGVADQNCWANADFTF